VTHRNGWRLSGIVSPEFHHRFPKRAHDTTTFRSKLSEEKLSFEENNPASRKAQKVRTYTRRLGHSGRSSARNKPGEFSGNVSKKKSRLVEVGDLKDGRSQHKDKVARTGWTASSFHKTERHRSIWKQPRKGRNSARTRQISGGVNQKEEPRVASRIVQYRF